MARAYREYVDSVTGERYPGPKAGAVPTGRYVVRKRVQGTAVLVPVDREYINPNDAAYAVDRDAKEEIESDAKRVRARIQPRKEGKRIRGYRTTFRSGQSAAQEFVKANPSFFHNVAASDPSDAIEDWMQRRQIKVGRTFQPMHKSKRGQALLRLPPLAAVTQILGLMFGESGNRSWAAVDWREVRSFLEELEEFMRDHAGPGMRDVMVGQEPIDYPPAAFEEPTREALEGLPPEARKVVRSQAERRKLAEVEEALRDARRDARACLPKHDRVTVDRRIRRVRWLLDRPHLIADSGACGEGDEALCTYSSLLEEASRIARACETPYDPTWAIREAETAAREGGEHDPRLAAFPRAVQRQAIEKAPKRKVLSDNGRSVLREAMRRDR